MTPAARIQRVVSCPMGKEVTVTPLRTRMIEEMTARGLAPRTVESYVRFVAQLATHFHRSPADLTDEQVRQYIASMSLERHLSASTVNVAVNAFRFFYHVVIGRKPVEFDIPRGRKQHRLPHVLSREEVQRLFAIPQNRKHHLMMLTAYATGVRVNELVHLRVSDIDSQRMTVRVEQGKGSRDRYTILSPLLLEALREYWRAERPKTWLFPSREGDHPPDVTGIQRVFKLTKERARITKPGGIHLLRHSFATHLLEQGVDVHRIQMLLGHRGLGTTAIYLHVTQREATQVGSPLELLDLPPARRR